MPPILFRPCNPSVHIDAAIYPQVAAYVDSWLKAFPGSQPSVDVDLEDWSENAVRLHEALSLNSDRVVLLGGEGIGRFLDGRVLEKGSEVIFLGTWFSRDCMLRDGVFSIDGYRALNMTKENIDQAEKYAGSEVFRRAAGRKVVLCGVKENDDDRVTNDLYDVLSDFVLAGAERVFLKVNLPKYAVSTIGLPAVASRKALFDCLHESDDGFAWSTVHLAGKDNAFIVQEYVEMRREYRVIVVDHRPIAGAGCIEEFTPVQNMSTWDCQLREYRHQRTEIFLCEETVEKYRAFANRFAIDHALERPGCKHYTLDLALNERGEVVAIELNPRLNYGLYAMSYSTILSCEVASAAL